MATKPTQFPHWHRLNPTRARCEALVLCLCDANRVGAARAFARQWGQVVPRSAFAALETAPGSAPMPPEALLHLIEDEAARLGLSPLQIVLVGQHGAARQALELARGSRLAPAGMILIDLPAEGPDTLMDASQGVLRFVQHQAAECARSGHFEHTLHALRQAGHDIRAIVLPDAPGPTERAIGTFLVELVARASRYHAPSPFKDQP